MLIRALCLIAIARAENQLTRRDLECDICQKVVTTANTDLEGEDRDKDHITSALGGSCAQFPKQDRTKCDTFLEQYSSELEDILIGEKDPNTACALLGVCSE
jgi:hypothetical protein